MEKEISLAQESEQWREHFSNPQSEAPAKESPAKAEADPEDKTDEIDAGKVKEPSKETPKIPAKGSEESKEAETVENSQEEEQPEDPKFKKPEILDKDKKAGKDTARLEKSWSSLNKEKETFAKSREEFERSKASFIEETRIKVRSEYMSKRPDIVVVDPTQYFDQAKTLEAKADALEGTGDYDQARSLRKDAYEWQKQGHALENQLKGYKEEEAKREAGRKDYADKVKSYRSNQFKELNELHPELADAKSPLRTKIDQIYKDPQLTGLFANNPNEYWFSVKLATLMNQAESASALAEENKKLKEEIQKVNKKLTPAQGSNPGVPPPKRNLDNMSLDESAEHFRSLAVAYDSR